MPHGMNDDCNWPAESGDVRQPSAEHLMDDVRVVEELALRYADARFDSKAAHGQLRSGCETKLFAILYTTHDVAPAALADARQQLGRNRWDAAVHLPPIALYLVTAVLSTSWIRRRFPSEEKVAAIFATLFGSLILAIVFVAFGHLWAGVVEMIRVGNTHMSYRAERLGWREHSEEIFAAAVLLFWCAVIVSYRGPGASPGTSLRATSDRTGR